MRKERYAKKGEERKKGRKREKKEERKVDFGLWDSSVIPWQPLQLKSSPTLSDHKAWDTTETSNTAHWKDRT